jgi:hypothetical protein
MTPLARVIAAGLVLVSAAGATAEETAQRPGTQKPPAKPAPPSPTHPRQRIPAKKPTPSGPRIFVHVNGGYQATTTDFRSTVPFRLTTDATEEAQLEAGYKVAAGPMLDVRGGARLHRRLGAAIAITRFTETGSANVRARLPHPFFLQRLRDVIGDPGDFRREELGIHPQATYMVPVTRRIVATVFGGPSFFNARQDLVERVQYSEEYPYDTATFTGVVKKRDTDSAVGFNVGMDVAYFFAKNVGAGGVVRFSRASMRVEPGAGQTQRADAGGLHLGAGIRFAF